MNKNSYFTLLLFYGGDFRMKVKLQRAVLLFIMFYIAINYSYTDEKKTNWQEEEISFTTGGFSLHGVLVKPQSEDPHPAVIFIH